MSDLKPCPFCGGDGCVMKSSFIDYDDSFYHVVCLDCSMEMKKFKHRTVKDAVEEWNRRTEWLRQKE